jgi:hypothetical protein
MDKKIFSTVFRRLHLATREHVGVEPLWRIMTIAASVVLVMLFAGGWYLYNWGITEVTVVNQVKPVAVSITEDELNRVEADVSQRNDHYERVLAVAPDVVAIEGNTSTDLSVATTTATTTKK